MNNFKIGDIIKPKAGLPQECKTNQTYKPLGGKIIDFLFSSGDKIYPIVKNQDGDLVTVNPDIYEKYAIQRRITLRVPKIRLQL